MYTYLNTLPQVSLVTNKAKMVHVDKTEIIYTHTWPYVSICEDIQQPHILLFKD